MSINFKNNQFHLRTKNTSYIMNIYDNKYLLHNYWGAALCDDVDLSYKFVEEPAYSRANAFHAPADCDSKIFISDMPLEYSVLCGGDYRIPTLEAVLGDNSPVMQFEYSGYSITNGKPSLPGLPAAYYESGDNTSTLQIELTDKHAGLKVYLTYSVFEDYDAITRSIRYENIGNRSITLTNAQSFCVDMPGQDYSIMHLEGDWCRERNISCEKTGNGIFSIGSNRGMSSHMHNPFIALLGKNSGETSGNVYGFALVYSGSFSAEIEKDSCGGTRVCMGIGKHNFAWSLNAGDTFCTPEALLIYSSGGVETMSNRFHKLLRERICRGKWRDQIRPTVINNWEATVFDFNEEKLLKIAENASKIGLELFVLDDGWFGKRNDDKSSLGDWTVFKDKLPEGLGSLSKKINKLNMKFGLWFEPEMISPDSDLYRAHPDWCLHAEGRRKTLNRWQLVLDLSRNDVCDYVVDAVSGVLSSANIEYVKWDCNRNITEIQDMEQTHKYVLGLYSILERLTNKFPNVLFESCSGGGGRFDAGMLYYMPQTWTSDETRPVPRMNIQCGTSMLYPAISMASHCGELITSFKEGDRTDIFNTSACVAMAANFGLEMDLSKLSNEDTKQAKEYVTLYKKIRNTVQFGNMYRLESGNNQYGDYSFEFFDGERAVIFTYQTKTGMNGTRRIVYPRGLNAETRYKCNGKIYFGNELMNAGFNITRERYEYASKIFIFEKVN